VKIIKLHFQKLAANYNHKSCVSEPRLGRGIGDG
jgi:hypothetical protein